MSKSLKITLNPSEEIIQCAQNEITVTDTQGRQFRLKKPHILAQYRLIEILGETARNEVYVSMVLPLLFISAIDNEDIPSPSNKREIEALIQRLDEPGMAAIMQAVQTHFTQTESEANPSALKK